MPRVTHVAEYLDSREKLSHFLRDIQAGCAVDRRVLADATHLAALTQFETEASRITDDLTLRFGVVGDSNAGKSRLIEALIGRVNAIPVNSIPFTGNVAILRISRGGNLAATELGSYLLEFVTERDARECLQFLFDKLTSELRDMSGTDEILRRSEAIQKQLRSEPISKADILAWLEGAWEVGTGVNARMRMMELGRFLVSWGGLGRVVCGKRNIPVTREAAEAAMVLPKASEASTFSSFVSGLEAQIKSVAGAAPLQELPSVITPAFSECCYSLIQNVRIDVRVPDAVWNLADLRVDSLELFDFPGLAAQGTAGRDTFLSLSESRRDRIHTWIVVVNSTELKGCQATELVKHLPDSRKVVVANRFDALPVWIDNPSPFQVLERLTSPDAPPVREEDALEQLDVLPPLTTLFERIESDRPDRCVLVSAMMALTELDQSRALLHQVLTDFQRSNEKWRSEVQSGRKVQAKWGLLAEKIRLVEPQSKLAHWLSAYAEDGGEGGLRQLRRILVAHADEFGLEQLSQEIQKRVTALHDAMTAFLIELSQATDEQASDANRLRSQLDELLAIYEHFAEPPSEVQSLQVRVGGLKSIGRPDAGISLLATPPKEASLLSETIRDETLLRVWEWPEWKRLLDVVRESGIVDCAGSTSLTQDFSGESVPWITGKIADPPRRAGEFHDTYRKAYCDVEAIAVAGVRSSLLDFLSLLETRLAPLRIHLGSLSQTHPKHPILFALQPLKLEHLFEAIKPEAPLGLPSHAFWRDRYLYLLQPTADGSVSPGPYFGWATPPRDGKAPKQTFRQVDNTNHQMCVFRLRTEFSTNIERCVLHQTFEWLAGFRRRFQQLRGVLEFEVNQLREHGDPELLATFGKSLDAPVRQLTLALQAVRNPFVSLF